MYLIYRSMLNVWKFESYFPVLCFSGLLLFFFFTIYILCLWLHNANYHILFHLFSLLSLFISVCFPWHSSTLYRFVFLHFLLLFFSVGQKFYFRQVLFCSQLLVSWFCGVVFWVFVYDSYVFIFVALTTWKQTGKQK